MTRAAGSMYFERRNGRFVLRTPAPSRPQSVRQRAKNVLTPVTRMRLVEQADSTCTYCARRSGDLWLDPDGQRWEMDHVVPLIHGGSPELDNVAVACARCNRSKRDRTLEEWKR